MRLPAIYFPIGGGGGGSAPPLEQQLLRDGELEPHLVVQRVALVVGDQLQQALVLGGPHHEQAALLLHQAVLYLHKYIRL